MTETGADSAMASGSDAGEPGESSDRRPLSSEEEALRAALERDAGSASGDFPEESDAAGRAADDEAPLPADGGEQGDGLEPTFQAPGD